MTFLVDWEDWVSQMVDECPFLDSECPKMDTSILRHY